MIDLLFYNFGMTKRKSMNHPQLIRISKIHKKILSGNFPNSNELAQELETSVVTISRDIEFMRDSMLAPIEYDASHRGYYYTEEFKMPNFSLSEKDAEVLSSAKILLSHFKGTPLYDDAENIINLISSTVVKNKSDNCIERIAVPPRIRIKYDKDLWNMLWLAIRGNYIVEFDYSGRWHSKIEHRRVRPYQLLLDDELFLFGFSEERNAERFFSFSRIKNLVITKDVFELPEDFSFESKCGGGKFGIFLSDDTVEYKIAFYNDARPLVRDMVLSDDEKIEEDEENSRTIVTFSSSQHRKVLEWLLSFAFNAKPLAPEDLVIDWKNSISWMADLAKDEA